MAPLCLVDVSIRASLIFFSRLLPVCNKVSIQSCIVVPVVKKYVIITVTAVFTMCRLEVKVPSLVGR